jgi:hypothetical protein
MEKEKPNFIVELVTFVAKFPECAEKNIMKNWIKNFMSGKIKLRTFLKLIEKQFDNIRYQNVYSNSTDMKRKSQFWGTIIEIIKEKK